MPGILPSFLHPSSVVSAQVIKDDIKKKKKKKKKKNLRNKQH